MIVAPEFRLARTSTASPPLDDAVACATWPAESSEAVGGSNAPLALMGDSSGGNLAALTAISLTRAATPLAFQVLIYPVLDATASFNSYVEFASSLRLHARRILWYFSQYLPPEVDRRAPRVSPLFELNLAGLPRTLVVTAECDPSATKGLRTATSLRNAGVDVDAHCHRG